MAKNAKNKITGYVYIRIAAVLLCLILASTYLIIGLFARYNSDSRADEGARVAKFSIHGSGQLTQSIVAEVIPGNEKTKQSLLIENNSEVAVQYTITVTNETNHLPLEFNVIKDASAAAGTPEMSPVDGADNTFTATQSAGSHSDNYILEISWPANTENPEEDIARIGMVDYITVTVTAEQID